MEQLTRKLDKEYYNGIRATNKIPKKSKKLFDELEDLKQKVNDIKKINRDEELLRMQRENQEIEEKLNQLKQQENTELKEKHKKEINDLITKKEELTQMLQNLEKDVESYNIYKKFIDQVNDKYSNDTTNQNDLYDNLKEKFEQLMKREIEIQKNKEDSEKEKEEIRRQIK